MDEKDAVLYPPNKLSVVDYYSITGNTRLLKHVFENYDSLTIQRILPHLGLVIILVQLSILPSKT